MISLLSLKPITSSFFARDTLAVARSLLGCYLLHDCGDGRKLVGRIVETEAYLADDPASHSFRGKTKRNAAMFEKAGTAYVYFTYGLYHCCNVVTNKKGVGEAVLIRALEPIEGIAQMQKNRAHDDTRDLKNLCNGPAKLVLALGINRSHDGLDLLSPSSPLRLMRGSIETKGAKGSVLAPRDIIATTRIGIRHGTELPHRFYLKDSPFVSKK